MTSFVKGMTFTMGGKEYEVLSGGTSDPSSSLVYVPRYGKNITDPSTLRIWKAESRLARGEIMINGFAEADSAGQQGSSFYPESLDPLEQIAELKKRISSIENRRVTLWKEEDHSSRILLQDNLVKPNKAFDIWAYAKASVDFCQRPIQYVKLRGLLLALSGNGGKIEHFLFNISDQLSPTCRITGDTLSSEGKIRIDLTPGMTTIQGAPTTIISDDLDGRVELTIELRLLCQYLTGHTIIHANILQAAYIREVNGPGLKTGRLAFPELGEHAIAIEGISMDIYMAAENIEKRTLQ